MIFTQTRALGDIKPRGRPRLNTNHPLGRGMVSGLLFNEAHENTWEVRDSVYGREWTLIEGLGGGDRGEDRRGYFFRPNPTSQGIWASKDHFNIADYPFTLACHFNATFVLNNLSPVMDIGNDSVVVNYAVASSNDANDYVALFTRNGGSSTDSSTIVMDGRHTAVGVWRSATDRELFVDGKSAATGTASIAFNGNRFGLAGLVDSTPSQSWFSPIYWAYFYDRALSAHEAWDLHHRPYSMWLPGSTTVFMETVGGVAPAAGLRTLATTGAGI